VAGALLLAVGLLLWGLGLDPALSDALRLDAGAAAVGPARLLTALGGFKAMGPLALAVALWWSWRRAPGKALWLIATITSGRLAVEALKLLVRRPRPPLAEHLDAVTSWSFPSSHSAGTMLTCTAIALAVGERWLAVAFVAAVAVGWSRIALAVHWPGDVMAGWGLALLWAAVAKRWLTSCNRIGSATVNLP
jgi:undecaprenyl-diphosphatase